MFDYEKIKSAAYKYKYETALETQNVRISYKELLNMIDAVYNSLCVMNVTGGAVAVLLRSGRDLVCSAFACDRAGFDCVTADSRISVSCAARLAEKYRPSVVIMPSCELERLAEIFLHCDCKTVVLTETLAQGDNSDERQLFPAQFDFDSLLERNDYAFVDKDGEKRNSKHVFFGVGDDSAKYVDKLPDALSALSPRTPIYISLPFYEQAGALAITSLLYGGRRCFLADVPDKKLFKRKKVGAVLCDSVLTAAFAEYSCEILTVETDPERPFLYAGGGLLNLQEINAELIKLSGMKSFCEFDGCRLRIVFETDTVPDMQSEYVKQLALDCRRLLSAYNVPKSFVFRKKTV